MPVSKMEIVNRLARRHGLTRYLELCTPTTGNYYALVDRRILTTAQRLSYNCPADFDDGLGIDFRSDTLDYCQCLEEIDRRALRYDIILVDPFHEYETSYRDLKVAFGLLDPGGFLVVHDCLPPSAEIAVPNFISGDWCGVTYKAYLDFVHAYRLAYMTVDTDFGCGIIRNQGGRHALHLLPITRRSLRRERTHALWAAWCDTGQDFDRAFGLLQAHKYELLNLVSAAKFARAAAGPLWPLSLATTGFQLAARHVRELSRDVFFRSGP